MSGVIVPGGSVAFGASSSLFSAAQTTGTTASTNYALPAGWLLIGATGAHTTIQFTIDGGTTFKTIMAASTTTYAWVWSDGQNFFAVNDSTGGTSLTYYIAAAV